jgi:hypothetical protein
VDVGPYRSKLGMKYLIILNLRMLLIGIYLGVLLDRFGEFLLGLGSGVLVVARQGVDWMSQSSGGSRECK